MGVTTVTRVENRTRNRIAVLDLEKQGTGHGVLIGPGNSLAVSMNVPWATTRRNFATRHLRVRIGGQPRYWIWQANMRDGDHVRFSIDGAWHELGERIDGISEPDGSRTLVVMENGIQLVQIPDEIVSTLRGLNGGFRSVWEAPPPPVPSVPKRSASAFSTAGPASDARSTVYRDSGKRYEFRIGDDGVVVATHPDGRQDRLVDAVSYTRKRAGERHQAPPFDLVAAADGRVLAKERGQDRFYFAQMDELFMHTTWRSSTPIPVPSTYFKVDPEANQEGRRSQDLTAHLEGSYANHPHAERFPLFRAVLAQEAIDAMVVRIEPRVWHLIDPRPPSSPSFAVGVGAAVAGWVGGLAELPLLPGHIKMAVLDLKEKLEQQVHEAREKDDAPPAGVPAHPRITYRAGAAEEFTARTISYRRVLDIGVGHVHNHQQYEGVTGGEIQPVRNVGTWGWAYQLFNGPVFDGDGYIDGTCNFYALVELGAPGSSDARGYALLYQDEQSYFSKRWRLVGPDDGGQLLFALAATVRWPFYHFERAKYWDPFTAGHVGAKSRLAVAAQVLLVTGDADRPETRSRIYSLNCSWSTMDHSWRWRQLPKEAEIRYLPASDGGAESIGESNGASTVYPQTIRLREDMTLHLKGTHRPPGADRAILGRWYQRYLPASNALVPHRTALPANAMPQDGYQHRWKFMREALFEQADRFSHFGVYDVVDSRTQYYTVTPLGAGDEQALAGGDVEPWEDHDFKLARWAPRFPWAAPFYWRELRNLLEKAQHRRPPSFYNRHTRLRIVRRGNRWLALHWDKRDDDLLPFGGKPGAQSWDFDPVEVALTRGGARARVRLTSHVRIEPPPRVQRVELRWSGRRESAASLVLFPAAEDTVESL